MTSKVYRTAQGKRLDLGALVLKNEKTRAIGNMNVNARGDVLDADNQSIDTRNHQVARQYRRQTTNVTDSPVKSSSTKIAVQPRPVDHDLLEDFDDQAQLPEIKSEKPSPGVAAAVARARKI